MANPLSDPNNWIDENGNSPPARWNGVSYEWFGVMFVGAPAQFIDYTGNTSDIPASFTVSVSTGADYYGVDHVLRAIFNGSENQDVALVQDTTLEHSFASPGDVSSLRLQVVSYNDNYPYAYSMDVAVTPIAQDDPPPPPPPPPPPFQSPCEEIGRATRAYVSAYQRDRVHDSSIVRGERRCLVADFNGALPLGRTIASAIWRCDQPFAVAMETARIFENDRSSAVDITGQYGRGARIKCQVTLDNGEGYNQLFIVRVKNFPWFQGETPPMSGPYDLMVSK